MLEALSTAVIELDQQGCVLAMNPAAENCFATGRERARGVRLSDFQYVSPELIEAVAESSVDQRTRRLGECRLAGGLYDCNIQPLDEGGILLELYDLKWQQQQTRLQQREVQTGMMELLRRNLGHEIRNPLGGIRGAAQMMAAELNGQELGTLAELIIREADRIDELLARFGQPELECSPLDLHFVLREVGDLLRMESADQVSIIQDFDPSIPPVMVDAAALRQLFLNLVRNAFQADAGRVTLRSRIEHQSALLQPGVNTVVRVDIEDDGCGVPESLRSMLFLPLVTGRRDGTGLGLALAQQIAAAHKGLLTYAPLPVGSRFTLRLPLERVHD